MSAPLKPENVKFIVIHCSATPPSADIGAAEIRRWHRAKGWLDIGYHAVIRRNGSLELGRSLNTIGAHVEGHNHESVGICMVGGTNAEGKAEDNFTTDQWQALMAVVQTMLIKFPGAEVVGHRDFAGVKKDCPSFDVKAWRQVLDGARYAHEDRHL